MEDKKRYDAMEECLNTISGKYISFPKEVVKRNNVILNEVLEPLIEQMKNDKLFKQLYDKRYFGGSYYDGLKVGSPNEYDIDLLLKFPSSHEVVILSDPDKDNPGYVNLYLPETSGFEKFVDNSEEDFETYLDTEKVVSWMHGVLQKALNEMKMCGLYYIFGGDKCYYVTYKKSGPAFTLIIIDTDTGIQEDMHVDLVPCFSFSGNKWPKGFRSPIDEENSDMSDFFIVPKHPKNDVKNKSKFWRLSFQIQERKLIHDLHRLKPVLRLLKKLRDVQQHNAISSYFLKTVFLWEVENQCDSFWIDNSLSYVFMYMLKKYQQHLANNGGKIEYFWNHKLNLLSDVPGDISNISNRLLNIIKDVEKNLPGNPYVIAKYLLTPEEYSHQYPKAEESNSDNSEDTKEQRPSTSTAEIVILGTSALAGVALGLMRSRQINSDNSEDTDSEDGEEERPLTAIEAGILGGSVIAGLGLGLLRLFRD